MSRYVKLNEIIFKQSELLRHYRMLFELLGFNSYNIFVSKYDDDIKELIRTIRKLEEDKNEWDYNNGRKEN